MPPDDHPDILTMAHSPDPDDAFMWLALGDVGERGGLATPREPLIDTGRFRFHVIARDVETLNQRAVERGDLDITAISFHTYPMIWDRYALTASGASMGDGYGPKVVAREARDPGWLRTPGLRIATPGKRTTAHLTLRLMLGQEFRAVETPFDEVMDRVASGDADAGVVIHEGQITYPQRGLALVVDLGAWWKQHTGLPLPLGGNAIRRDLDERFGAGALAEVAGILSASIRHSMANRAQSLAHAASYARGVTPEQNDEFVRMYVNDLTIDAGETGARAIERLLGDAHAAGLCPDPGPIDLVR
jgi:1,4-dihydroxy-6-naphthoate synthase